MGLFHTQVGFLEAFAGLVCCIVRLVELQVPILRNRQRALFFVETPWDRFGPVPPTDPDYRYSTDLDLEQ